MWIGSTVNSNRWGRLFPLLWSVFFVNIDQKIPLAQCEGINERSKTKHDTHITIDLIWINWDRSSDFRVKFPIVTVCRKMCYEHWHTLCKMQNYHSISNGASMGEYWRHVCVRPANGSTAAVDGWYRILSINSIACPGNKSTGDRLVTALIN